MRSVFLLLINNSRLEFAMHAMASADIRWKHCYSHICMHTEESSTAPTRTRPRMSLSRSLSIWLRASSTGQRCWRRLLALGKSICFGSFCACRFYYYIFSIYSCLAHSLALSARRRTLCYVCFVRNSTTNSIDSKRLSILIKFLVTNLPFLHHPCAIHSLHYSVRFSFLLFGVFSPSPSPSSSSSSSSAGILSSVMRIELEYYSHNTKAMYETRTMCTRYGKRNAMCRVWVCRRAREKARVPEYMVWWLVLACVHLPLLPIRF